MSRTASIPNYSFMKKSDPFHAFFRYKLSESRSHPNQEEEEDGADNQGSATVSHQRFYTLVSQDIVPPDLALDLTAQFAAWYGKPFWLLALSLRILMISGSNVSLGLFSTTPNCYHPPKIWKESSRRVTLILRPFMEMREQGSEPDKITFLGFLSACTHGGLIDEGKLYFREMIKEFGISPSLQHYALMVVLLGRAGLVTEALSLIWEMDIKPDSAVWGALLSACIVNRDIEIGEYVAKKMFMLDHRNGGLYVLMSNLYATEEMWDHVARVRRMMKDYGYDGYLGVSQTL